tara:strand:- start:101 stop:811 length:711 start_codon:yes stop_codon:yes gene_type:complete
MKKNVNLILSLIFIYLISFNCNAHDASKAWKNAYKSTVIVLPTWPGYNKPGYGAPEGTAPAGTGFYISIGNDKVESNFIMTAAHVIKNSSIVEIKNYKNEYDEVKVILVDYKTDIAILKSNNKGQSITFSKKKIENGNQVCVIGNSFGLGQSLSCGIISGKNRKGLGFNQIENFIQTDAAVNPGASGAPLVNEDGQLEGMVDAIYTKEADIDAGVNFAIDKELIQQFLKSRSNKIN